MTAFTQYAKAGSRLQPSTTVAPTQPSQGWPTYPPAEFRAANCAEDMLGTQASKHVTKVRTSTGMISHIPKRYVTCHHK